PPFSEVTMATHDPNAVAHRVAEAVDTAWHRTHGSGHLDIPVSTIAALSLLTVPAPDRHHLVDALTRADRETVLALVSEQWRLFANARPDLATPVFPLVNVWYGDTPVSEQARQGAHEAARAALAAGLFDLTGDPHRRHDVDLFGVLLTVMKSRTAKTVNGAFYTPTHIADLLAHLTLSAPGPVPSVHEPAIGTGGLWRAAAQALRDHGHDPARVLWVGADVDPLAIACAAVNAVLWGLGPRVLLTVGDTLTDDVITRAHAQRAEAVRLAREVRKTRRLFAALDALTHPTRKKEDP
ncbi:MULTISPECIES: N-6 DNA methylase, partial [unclassified Nocardiopsis]|uniref:N-6 DNA methylase n=1 Tax=Nocardiopsis TaxID=2013 RepID=UPI00387AB485